MSVKIVDWRITSSCDNMCGFCYAASDLPSVALDQIDDVVKAIYETDCETVCITGGEPLLDPNYVIEIMKKLSGLGITIFLSTNGTNYINNIASIEPFLSKLSLPVDGFDAESNSINGRTLKSFVKVKNILELYSKKNHAFPIKISTILSKKSLDIEHFKKIYLFLKQYSIDLWKIYQFIPESRGLNNQKEYAITEKEWNNFKIQLMEYLEEDMNNRQFDIGFAGRNERNSAYFIIQPDASVIIPIDDLDGVCTEETIGNLLTDNTMFLVNQWQEKINSLNVIGNSEKRNITRPIHKLHIDEINRMVLHTFDKYPLLENAELAKKISVSENDLRERIKKLLQIRAIKRVIPIVNISHFGLDIYLVNLFFSTKERVAYIADILCHHKNIAWVAECYDWDETTNRNAIFRIAIFAESNLEASSVLHELGNIFGKMLVHYEIDIVPDKYVCDQRFMLRQPAQIGMDASHISLDHKGVNSISPFQLKLLNILHSIERPTIHDLALKLKTHDRKVEKSLDELRKNLIITKYQAVFDSNVLGYKCYLVFVKFVNITEKKIFEDYAKKLNEVSHINTLNNGRWDIDVEIKVEHADQCFALIREFQNRFQQSIMHTKLIRVEKEHKFEFLIPSVLDAAKKAVRHPFTDVFQMFIRR